MSIRVSGLRKTFGAVTAVDRLSLEIPQGQMLVLLGPSGCGKTTTMRCIAGLDRPDEGAISIAGTTVFDAGKTNVPVNKRNIGMVFQSYAIWPHMTVFDNVAFPLKVNNLARSEITVRVEEMLKQVGLSDLSQRGASYLSGGQMQRVALARSLVMRPSVLLFDEPLSNLDARLRDRLRIQLRELQTQFKITAVYVTHDQHEALALADQIAVMYRGDVLQLTDPVSIYSQPKSSTVADFLGYSNIFRVVDRKQQSAGCWVQLEGNSVSLVAMNAPPESHGDIFACIRPEDILVAPIDSKAGRLDNNLSGDVILASFMGSFMQYRVRISDSAIFEITSPRITSEIKFGDHVCLTIPPQSIRLLPSL